MKSKAVSQYPGEGSESILLYSPFRFPHKPITLQSFFQWTYSQGLDFRIKDQYQTGGAATSYALPELWILEQVLPQYGISHNYQSFSFESYHFRVAWSLTNNMNLQDNIAKAFILMSVLQARDSNFKRGNNFSWHQLKDSQWDKSNFFFFCQGVVFITKYYSAQINNDACQK